MFEQKVILVTGGSGSWGYELIRKLLSYQPKKVIIYSRNEDGQVKMNRYFSDPRLSFCIGDVRDREALCKACEGVDYIFHLAALKHVPICEEQPLEALKTNVIGTQNVIEAAIENGVKKVINVSTDKAADPSNFYGMTKAIGEKLIIYANLYKPDTQFINVRSGNVLGTNGSVLHLFAKQIKETKQVTITDKQMTRFFLTQKDAINMLLEAAREGQGGETFVMNMPSCRVLDLAEVLIQIYGSKDVAIVETGPRPGEKLHEKLISKHESSNTVIFNNRFLVVLPVLNIPNLTDYYSKYPRANIRSYNSKDQLMNREEIAQMLREGGFV